jgi:hypothetical protein
MATFQPIDGGQLFCCTQHRRAWNNRWVTRGAVVAPLAAVARLTRNGSRGSAAGRTYGARAGSDADTLFRRWRAEDAAAGRMSWEDYLKRRYLLGYDPT